MALSYPLAFPTITQFEDTPSFKLSEALAINRSGAGAMETMELADPIWSGRWLVYIKREADRGLWTAWRMALIGGAGFLGHDPGRPFPLAYGQGVLALLRHGGGAFDGTATLSSFTATTITLSNLPDLYRALPGDRVSLVRPGSQRSLHEVVETVTGNSSGVVTLNVQPPVPSDVTPGSTAVQLVRPQAIFVLSADTFDAPSRGNHSVSFEGTQTTAPQA
jgi:hypothetical protein